MYSYLYWDVFTKIFPVDLIHSDKNDVGSR